VLKYIKNKVSKYIISKEINKFITLSKPKKEKVELVDINVTEFELPRNAQYNPRIPDLVNGKVFS